MFYDCLIKSGSNPNIERCKNFIHIIKLLILWAFNIKFDQLFLPQVHVNESAAVITIIQKMHSHLNLQTVNVKSSENEDLKHDHNFKLFITDFSCNRVLFL